MDEFFEGLLRDSINRLNARVGDLTEEVRKLREENRALREREASDG